MDRIIKTDRNLYVPVGDGAQMSLPRPEWMYRKDAPEYRDLLELQEQGLVTSELVEFDEQSSALRWRWVKN